MVRTPTHGHSGHEACLDAGRCVLEHDGVGRVDAEGGRGLEVAGGMRLAGLDLTGGDQDLRHRDPRGLQARKRDPSRAGGHDREAVGRDVLNQIAGARKRVQRACQFPPILC